MLIEVAIGDAYGAGFEFVEEEVIKKYNTLTSYYDSRIDNIKAGQYTDDTQMTLAIVELLLEKEVWNKEVIAKYFIKAFQRDQRQGYAKGFYKFLLLNDTPEDFIKNIKPNSIRNGAAMRSVPLSFIKDKKELLEKCELQAIVTHNTKEGIISSQAVALIGHYFLYNKLDKSLIVDKLFEDLDILFNTNKNSRVACDAIETIDAVLTILLKTNSYSEILKESINLGGDTDSVASIALGLASLTDQYKIDLPEFLYEEIENNRYGKDYILYLEDEIREKFNV